MEKTERNDDSFQNRRISVKELFESAPCWAKWSKKHDLLRVATAICVLETKLHYYERSSPLSRGEREPAEMERYSGKELRIGFIGPTIQMCWSFLSQAKEALSAGYVDSAWAYVNELDRKMLTALEVETLQARLISAEEEAREKLGQWRSSAAARILRSDTGRGESKAQVTESVKEPPAAHDRTRQATLEILKETLFHLHSSSENLYRNIQQLRIQIGIASLSVTVLVLAILVLNQLGFFDILDPGLQNRLPLGVLSGLLGGVLSVAYTVARTSPKQKIPEVKASFSVTIVRPIIGAAVALPVLGLIESGLINIPDQGRLWIMLSFCFLAGFSERWFLGIMKRLETRKT